MHIAIIGTGHMANSITANLSKSEELTIYSKEESKAKELADKYAQSAKKLEDNIEEEIVILAVPYTSVPSVFNENPNSLQNKTLVDISNAMDWQKMELLPGEGALTIAKSLPSGSNLIKAFNTIPAPILETGKIEDKPLDVFLAGDDQDAKNKLAEAINNSGLRAIDVGNLSHTPYLESLLLINSLAGAQVGNGKPVSTKILS